MLPIVIKKYHLLIHMIIVVIMFVNINRKDLSVQIYIIIVTFGYSDFLFKLSKNYGIFFMSKHIYNRNKYIFIVHLLNL